MSTSEQNHPKYLSIEIGGTKLQLGIGTGNGILEGQIRAGVEVKKGAEGIRQQIIQLIPDLLSQMNLNIRAIRGIGIGFGGPLDSKQQKIIKSHQILGWDDFPISEWLSNQVQKPVVAGNDADVAGLAEAHFGAGKGASPIFYITVGSGIGGGFIIDGQIYQGVGRGAAEIGHLQLGPLFSSEMISASNNLEVLEKRASGWGIASHAQRLLNDPNITSPQVWLLADQNNRAAQQVIGAALDALALAICQVIALLCPARIVIGGGVSLIGEKHFFEPIRDRVEKWVFPPFRDLFQIVPAALGEEVVLHGGIALAKYHFESPLKRLA